VLSGSSVQEESKLSGLAAPPFHRQLAARWWTSKQGRAWMLILNTLREHGLIEP